jgi:hypothetical protein
VTCLTLTGNLWLLLEDGVLREDELGPRREGSRWLNLETGEVRSMTRAVAELVKYGWREVAA